MKLYILTTLLLLTTFVYGQHIEKHRWGSKTKQSDVGLIRGKNASIQHFPFMASFKIDGSFLGSGVILNNHWILTTAFIISWVSTSEVKIRIGSDDYNEGGTVLEPQQLVVPSGYIGDFNYDIGLVKVKKPIKFGKKVKSIKIGSGELKNGTKVTIAGWGATKVDAYTASKTLMSSKVTVLDRKTCSSTSIFRQMCTLDNKAGPAVYDFGDPLILKNKVYGLFAGADSLDPGYPMYYTDVTKYKKWIRKYTRRS